MDITKSLNKVIAYIESNLDSEIKAEQAAKIAAMPTFHFIKMFSFLTGISFSEYIRKRRLTLASQELQTTDAKVIDLCYKYGYDSPTSFNRAFKAFHGVPPSKAKDIGCDLKAFLPITFQITVKGVTAMDYRIEKKQAIRAIGYEGWFSVVPDNQNFIEIPKFWQDVMNDGRFKKLMEYADTDMTGSLGICGEMKGNDFPYYIAVASTQPVPEGMVEIMIEPAEYALFPTNLANIQETTKRIHTEWFATSGYNHSGKHEIEHYYDGSEECKVNVMIPVVKK